MFLVLISGTESIWNNFPAEAVQVFILTQQLLLKSFGTLHS